MTEQDELMIAEELFNWIHPVGSYYETSDINWSPQNADWYGTWVEDTEGLALVSRNSGTFKNVGDVIGEEKHKMTIEELVEHGHDLQVVKDYATNSGSDLPKGANSQGDNAGWGNRNDYPIKKTGGSKPFNIIQPSKVVIRWHRIA